jgi:hypothetical protein
MCPEFSLLTSSADMLLFIITYFSTGSIFNVCQNWKTSTFRVRCIKYVRVLISLMLFLFAVQSKEFFLDGLKKLEQRSHKCVELRGICRVNTFFQNRSLLFSL